MGTLATKTIPNVFLDFNPKKKIRIRFSLMPQNLSSILEPNTAPIIYRIEAIDRFITAGYDVHINFSPVIVYPGWLADYENLFKLVDTYVKDENKPNVKAEVIFLTHNQKKHAENVSNNLAGEHLLWKPELQEEKVSSYGGVNVRYKYEKKKSYIDSWTSVHNKIIPWNTIRYCF